MEKIIIRRPFFTVNPKVYLYGKKILDLAVYTDQLAEKYDIDVFFTVPAVDIPIVKEATKKIIITAQHLDGILPGKGMGCMVPEALKEAGVQATFLNHAERPLTTNQLAQAIERSDELGIVTIVCADSVAEAQSVAQLHPDIMICEPTALIGTGKVSGKEYMESTNQAVKSISPAIQVLQAAGISTAQDVYDAIAFGAGGTGGTSGIVCSENPQRTLDEMFESLVKARNDIEKGKIS